MITIKYKKTEYARFLSHLDLQSIIIRSIRRTGILPSYSKGYNPHPILKMSPPILLGLVSIAEYFTIDIMVENKQSFIKLLNNRLPTGILCIDIWETSKTPKLMDLSVAASYIMPGDIYKTITDLPATDGEIILENSNKRIYSIQVIDNTTQVVLPAGKDNYRIDKFLLDVGAKDLLNIGLNDVVKNALLLNPLGKSQEMIDADKYLLYMEKEDAINS